MRFPAGHDAEHLEEFEEAPPAGSAAVETRGLTKRFGHRRVVDDVSLSVPRVSAFGYLGPNGAGKTTLIRMLLGLTSASAGAMRLLGLPVPEMRAAALARTGAMVEEPRFHPHLTGRENLSVVAAARNVSARHRIDESLTRRRNSRPCGTPSCSEMGRTERGGDRQPAMAAEDQL